MDDNAGPVDTITAGQPTAGREVTPRTWVPSTPGPLVHGSGASATIRRTNRSAVNPPESILVVCTANVCRSPVGAALLASATATTPGPPRLHVASAGTHASPGAPAAEQSQALTAAWGVDLSGHRATALSAEQVEQASLVLVMEERHRQVVVRLRPGAIGRTFTWLEFARLVGHLRDADAVRGSDGADRLRALARQAHLARPLVPHPDGPEDVTDPFGGSPREYGEMANTLETSATRFLPALQP